MNARPDAIYFVEAEGLDLVKIGCSSDVARRVRALQGGSPVKLRLAAAIEGDRLMEAQLHVALAPEWSHFEWFRLSERIRGLIDVINAGGVITDVISFPLTESSPRPWGRDGFTARAA